MFFFLISSVRLRVLWNKHNRVTINNQKTTTILSLLEQSDKVVMDYKKTQESMCRFVEWFAQIFGKKIDWGYQFINSTKKKKNFFSTLLILLTIVSYFVPSFPCHPLLSVINFDGGKKIDKKSLILLTLSNQYSMSSLSIWTGFRPKNSGTIFWICINTLRLAQFMGHNLNFNKNKKNIDRNSPKLQVSWFGIRQLNIFLIKVKCMENTRFIGETQVAYTTCRNYTLFLAIIWDTKRQEQKKRP